ncbi:MAG: hypothetical protein ACJAW3_001041 [Lentimonas sp.]|jgi:hypothetical protein
MIDKKKFTISIGDYGIIVALHNGKNVENKILVANLNDDNRDQLSKLFFKHKSSSTHILIDTTHQNYKRKTYPPLNILDFHKLAKMDLKKEFDNEEKSLRSYYYSKNKNKKWDCIFVSTTLSEEIEKWIELLLGVQNNFSGIYMLPIETYNLAKNIFDITADKDHKTPKNRQQILSLIVQNKISGTRQIIFSDRNVVFTRVVNYDFDNKNFAARFEQDIFRSNEYLKMIFPHLKSQDVAIINVMPKDIIDKIKDISNHDLKFSNYQPSQIAKKLGLSKAVTNNGNFSDIIIANFFVNHKKTLKFFNPRLTMLSRLKLIIKSAWVLNFIIITATLVLYVQSSLQKYNFDQELSKIKTQKSKLEKHLEAVSSKALDLDEKSDIKNEEKSALADAIINFGRIDEILSKNSDNINSVYNQLIFIKSYSVAINSFSYQLTNYKPKLSKNKTKEIFIVGGVLSDESGDIEALFRKFDNLTLNTKKQFPEDKIKYSELSKDVDFSKKYYSFPINLSIEKINK